DFCSLCSPMQCWPPPLGAGLLQLRVLDLWPPEQEPQEDQQLQLPWITPGMQKEGSAFLSCALREHCFYLVWLPGCSPITAPLSQAGPDVPGLQTQ
ncbi:hypothetical protein XENOCAPTIV_007820, partial [Xenoophorus captivus]